MRNSKMETEEVTQTGTIGEDVMTVHKVRTRHDRYGNPYLWPVCEAGTEGDEVTEWLRAANCPTCLSADWFPSLAGCARLPELRAQDVPMHAQR